MDIESITLLDVIDRGTLQSLQDAFAEATGMAALATDSTGAVTQLSNPTEFCMNLTRKSSIGCERCNKCDLQGGADASRTGKPSTYFCHGGLVDFAAPIIIHGRHIGSLIGGQVLTEAPDDEKFRRIAREINVDPEQYVRAVHKVPIVPKSRIDAAANLLYQMANALSDIGYQRAQALERSEHAEGVMSQIHQCFQGINEQTEKSVSAIKTLAESFHRIEEATAASAKAVDNTDKIVKTLENSSTQLTLIGFNASIEAKRAGKAGEGFNVIAQEVRTLSDRNKKQSAEIDHTLSGIRESIQNINEQIKDVRATVEQDEAVIEKLRAMLAEVNSLIAEIR